MDISSSWGGTCALASLKMPISSRACFALSVVKYVYDVPFMPARCEKRYQHLGQPRPNQRDRETHSCATDTVDVVLAIVREIIVLYQQSARYVSMQERTDTHDNITNILHVYACKDEQPGIRRTRE